LENEIITVSAFTPEFAEFKVADHYASTTTTRAGGSFTSTKQRRLVMEVKISADVEPSCCVARHCWA
jgi:hypothetical protein